jgi:hypothetical protein
MALSEDELARAMDDAFGQGMIDPCFPCATFSLHLGEQKNPSGILSFLRRLKPSFFDELVLAGKTLSEAQGIQASKACIASFSSRPELEETKDSNLKKYLLKTGSVVFNLRSNDQRKLDTLIRNFAKHSYAGILMAIVKEFYPADYQSLVDFINTMPAKPVVEEGGCAVACDGSAKDPFDETLVAFQGLPVSCVRESFGHFPGLVHADYSRGQPQGVLRFRTPKEAADAFAIASEPTFQIEGVHPAVHLLTKEKCEAYSVEITAMKLKRKIEGRHRKH